MESVPSLREKKERLLALLTGMKNSQERFAYVVRRGRESSGIPPTARLEAERLEGCLAKVWFSPDFREGLCYFRSDSDSAIVKGIATILCEFYSGEKPEHILGTDPSFLEKAGIDQHLTPNRRNSLSKVWDKIRLFAAARATPAQT